MVGRREVVRSNTHSSLVFIGALPTTVSLAFLLVTVAAVFLEIVLAQSQFLVHSQINGGQVIIFYVHTNTISVKCIFAAIIKTRFLFEASAT